MAYNKRKDTIDKELAKRIKKNICRWCVITIKKTGEELLINRTGYRSMEDWYKDSWEIKKDKNVIFEGSWDQMVSYIDKNY